MAGTSTRQDFERAAMEAVHETAGPLSTVRAALELVGAALDPVDRDAQRALSLAQRQLRLAQMQLARFSRLRGGAEPPEARPTDLTELARELVDDLSTSILADHDTEVEAPREVTVDLDPDQIRGLLFNLLSNAAKYSPSGRRIVVAIDVADDVVELRVRDQGSGVAPEDAERVFERYERGDAVVGGVGLGLAIAREIARGHGGELVLEPAEEEGSTFLLTLPLEAGQTVAQ